jgi:hypothetical protein
MESHTTTILRDLPLLYRLTCSSTHLLSTQALISTTSGAALSTNLIISRKENWSHSFRVPQLDASSRSRRRLFLSAGDPWPLGLLPRFLLPPPPWPSEGLHRSRSLSLDRSRPCLLCLLEAGLSVCLLSRLRRSLSRSRLLSSRGLVTRPLNFSFSLPLPLPPLADGGELEGLGLRLVSHPVLLASWPGLEGGGVSGEGGGGVSGATEGGGGGVWMDG